MSAEHKPHQEQPLHDFIDMEAYDVVSGETYRSLLERMSTYENMLREAENTLRINARGPELIGLRHRIVKVLDA